MVVLPVLGPRLTSLESAQIARRSTCHCLAVFEIHPAAASLSLAKARNFNGVNSEVGRNILWYSIIYNSALDRSHRPAF